jgi:hypothetical protein
MVCSLLQEFVIRLLGAGYRRDAHKKTGRRVSDVPARMGYRGHQFIREEESPDA